MCKREAKGESLTTRYCIGFPEGLACLGCRLWQAVAESASCLLPCCVHCPQTPSTTQQSLQRTPGYLDHQLAGMLYIHTYRRRPAPRGESLFHSTGPAGPHSMSLVSGFPGRPLSLPTATGHTPKLVETTQVCLGVHLVVLPYLFSSFIIATT